jgi:hypothetical protein
MIQLDSKSYRSVGPMPKAPEDILRENCKSLIEAKLGWGPSEDWANRDFDLLSDEIYKVTGVALSQTTLKRIWGKVKYDSAPTVTTLDTLARFLGFEHWRDFRLHQNNPIASLQKPVHPRADKKYKKPWLIAAFGAVLLTIVFASWSFLHSRPTPEKKIKAAPPYQFSSRKIVSLGVPNSVVFEYDAAASPIDSIFIQQSWDNNLRAQVPKDQHLHTSIYYYPGHFQAKLLVGHEIVKEHDVIIQTDGWLALVEQQPVPVYFRKGEGIANGRLGLSMAQLKSHNVQIGPVNPVVYYANIREFDGLKTDDFILETSVRNDFNEGSGACQKSEVRLICEGSMISIPLSSKGCVSADNLFCLGRFISGNQNDLSAFGVDFHHFVRLTLEVKNGKANFFVDQKLAYQMDHLPSGTKIEGIIFRFQGTGSVDWVRLFRGDGTPVYDEEF